MQVAVWIGRFRNAAFLGTVVVLIAGAGVLWLHVARTLTEAKPVNVAGPPPSAIVWGDRVFSSSNQLRDWLDSRGMSYRGWAQRHPAAVRIVDPGKAVPASRNVRRSAPHPRIPPTRATAAAHGVDGRDVSRVIPAIPALAGAILAALAAFAVAFKRGIVRLPPQSKRVAGAVTVRGLRLDRVLIARGFHLARAVDGTAGIYLLAGAGAILVGVGIAALFG